MRLNFNNFVCRKEYFNRTKLIKLNIIARKFDTHGYKCTVFLCTSKRSSLLIGNLFFYYKFCQIGVWEDARMRLSQKWKVVNVHQCCGESFNSRCFSNIRSLSHTVAKENHRRVHENCDRDCCFSITNFIFLYFTLCTTRVTRFVKRCLKHYSYFITLVIQINSPITNTYT